jgi:hypothetical protein
MTRLATPVTRGRGRGLGTMTGFKNLASKLPPARTTPSETGSGKPSGQAREDLPYRVELWDHPAASVEQILAATKSSAIGFAAYYQASQEFPDRTITLRHKNSVVARWNARNH